MYRRSGEGDRDPLGLHRTFAATPLELGWNPASISEAFLERDKC